MPTSRSSIFPRFPVRAARRSRAFTTVELMIVVVIIAILAAMGLPAFQRILVHVRGNALLSDFRVFSAGFLQYAHTHGAYPPSSSAPGAFPTQMAGIITPDQWTRLAPIGGQYEFLNNVTIGGADYRAVIRVSPTSAAPINLSSDQLQLVDRRSDDGNLAAGNFIVSGVALSTYFVVEK